MTQFDIRYKRGVLYFLACVWTGVLSSLQAQTVISNPVVIPLETISATNGGSVYYKYGIWIGLGGGTPQLFEFDTGGNGFYPAYDTNSPWWGTFTPSGETITNTYDSGLQYTAEAVQSSLEFYSSGAAVSPLISTSTNLFVGQTSSIVNTNTPADPLWPNTNSAPPVDGNFYGDFGLTLKPGKSVGGSNNIANIFAQFDYTGGVGGGFIVHTGPYGSTNGAYVQVGVTAADMATFPLIFQMQGQDTNTLFPGSGYPTYSAQVLGATMTLDNAYTTNFALNLDTGNPTPGLHNVPGGVPPVYIDGAGNKLKDNILLALQAVQTNGASTNFFSLTTGSDYGVNNVYVQEGSDFYMNIGVSLFYQYDVLFNFEEGLVGLRTPQAIPEPRTLPLAAACLLAVGALLILRKRRAQFTPSGGTNVTSSVIAPEK